MSSLEAIFKTILANDATIAAIAGNRIYTSGEIGINGLTYESSPEVYLDGDVLPSVLIRQRDDVPDGNYYDSEAAEVSSNTVVEIYVYQERGYVLIDQILYRCRKLLPLGYLSGTEGIGTSFEFEWILTTGRLTDEAALNGASLVRQDWSVNIIF